MHSMISFVRSDLDLLVSQRVVTCIAQHDSLVPARCCAILEGPLLPPVPAVLCPTPAERADKWSVPANRRDLCRLFIPALKRALSHTLQTHCPTSTEWMVLTSFMLLWDNFALVTPQGSLASGMAAQRLQAGTVGEFRAGACLG